MDAVLALHGRFATVLVLYFGAVGVWGVANGLRGRGPTPGYRGALAIAEVAAIVQGVFGALAFLFVHQPSETLHVLYGFALAAALPLAVSFVRDRAPGSRSLWIGITALFAAGLAIRGITTA
jgi:hypothetical protein